MGLCDALVSACEELDARTLDFAERAAKVPVELQQLNKRSVHRAMEIMGARAAMRAGTEIQALAFTDGGEQELHVDLPPRRIEREVATRSARHHVRRLPDEEGVSA